MFRLLSSCLIFSFLTTFFSFLTTFAYADEPCAPDFSAFLVKFEALFPLRVGGNLYLQ